jgi:hypothetical protein
MKVIRNSVCYVEKNDILFLGMLPEEIVEAPFIVESKWVKFENQKAVNFFRETEVIIDYDELSNKKEEELLETENKVEKELNDICTKWLYASSYYRRNLDKDPEYNEKIKELKYLLATIKNYLSEKTNYDSEIRQLSFDTTVTSTKKSQPKEKNLINNKA